MSLAGALISRCNCESLREGAVREPAAGRCARACGKGQCDPAAFAALCERLRQGGAVLEPGASGSVCEPAALAALCESLGQGGSV